MTDLNIEALCDEFPLIKKLQQLDEISWFNPNITSLKEALPYVGLDDDDIHDASYRLNRFAPYLAKVFPETAITKGIIESDVIDIPAMKTSLEKHYDTEISGRLMLKKDSHLPISGSIKARGGIYEVLTHAERLAMSAGLLSTTDDYSKLGSEYYKKVWDIQTLIS